ncbi:hypothetical protein T4C_12989, partial [Trichinella pseudospiralis]
LASRKCRWRKTSRMDNNCEGALQSHRRPKLPSTSTP